MTPILSILTCTLPSRRRMAANVWDRLAAWADRYGKPGAPYPYDGVEVELLSLCDNKTRTIGAKRQALLDIARGEYVSFVDDDDEPSEDYVPKIVATIFQNDRPDLIVFPIKVTINGGSEGIVEPSIRFVPKKGEPLAEYAPPVTYRPPHELCVWRTEIARKARFPDANKGEDFGWAAQAWPHVAREVRIDACLYWWRHEIRLREHHEEPA